MPSQNQPRPGEIRAIGGPVEVVPIPLLTKEEYAAHFRVSPKTVDDWVRKGVVTPILTPSGRPRFRVPAA